VVFPPVRTLLEVDRVGCCWLACREPMTYKEFVYRELGDDVTPEEAKRAYDGYLEEFWGSQIRAQFETHRNEAW
jgi:SERRATE/Ars2, N-terminal domain